MRFRGFNGTHELISILDNASAHGAPGIADTQLPTHSNSRALLLALQTDVRPMRATIVAAIEHPGGPGSYAPRRGNVQELPDGNVFIGWSEQATHSEHTVDGTLVMNATLITQWLGSYRSYKFPFVGLPTELPRVVSNAVSSAGKNTTTLIHASQNGATEIDHWKVYKTTKSGGPMLEISTAQKTGFETTMTWHGYAAYVVVQAIDKDGNVLATSATTKTNPPSDIITEDIVDEIRWQQQAGEGNATNGKLVSQPDQLACASSTSSSAADYLPIVFSGTALAVILVLLWLAQKQSLFKQNRPHKYEPLTGGQER